MIFRIDTQSTGHKSKNKWDFIKLKTVYTAKETVSKMKMRPKEWKKHSRAMYLLRSYYPNHIGNSYNSQAKQSSDNLILNMGEGLE